MNLGQSIGNMAGGAVQGFQNQERLQLAQKSEADSVNLRNRQMVMAEKDQAQQDLDRDRVNQSREEGAAYFKDFWGDKTETVGETSQDDGNGNITKVPTVVTKPGRRMDNPEDVAQYALGHAMIAAKHSGMTPEAAQKIYEMVDNGRRTAAGRALDKVLAGDESAMGAYLKGIGRDPKGATLEMDIRKGVMRINVADGGPPVDLKMAYGAVGTAAQVKQRMDEEKRTVEMDKGRAQTANLGATQALNEAKASEIPSKIGRNNAEAYKAGQQGGLAAARGASVRAGAGAAVDKKLSSDIMTNAKGAAGPDPTGDGKAPYTEKYAFLTGRANELARGGKVSSGLGAVAAARKEWQTTESQVADQLSKVDKKVLKEKYKTSDVATLTARAMKTWAAKNTVATPVGGGGGGDVADEADASE